MALKTEKYRKYYLKCSNTFLAGCILICKSIHTLNPTFRMLTLKLVKQFNHGFENFLPVIYIHKRVLPLTHWLNIALAILWKADSRILVYRLVFRPWPPLRRSLVKYRSLPPPSGSSHQKQVFEHNSAPDYLTMSKLNMG